MKTNRSIFHRITFRESQRMGGLPLYIALGSFLLVDIILVITMVTQSGMDWTTEIGFTIGMVLIIQTLVVTMLRWMRLDTEVTQRGIRYRMIPFMRKWKSLSWDEIEHADVRKYSPISQYGGWGVRKTFKGGTAYNMKGCLGLYLTLRDGKTLLLGTQEPDELDKILSRYYENPVAA